MKRSGCVTLLITIGIATLSFGESATAAASEKSMPSSGRELNEFVREAHTPAQFHVLADYYAQQQASYQRQAAEEKLEWERRSTDVSGPAAKYPRPVDSAKSLYEYYAFKADRAGSLANHYRQLEPLSGLTQSR